MGERLAGSQKVIGSSPLSSTFVMIVEIAQAVLEQLGNHRKYELVQWNNPAVVSDKLFCTIQWSEQMPPGMKQQCVSCEVNFYDGYAAYSFGGFTSTKFDYCDPKFPDNLVDYMTK